MRGRLVAGALTLSLASPLAAATDPRIEMQTVERRTGAFAGVAFKVAMGSKEASKPTARLQLGPTQLNRASGPGASVRTTFQGSALELGLLGGKPMFFVGGQSTKVLKQQANLNGGNTWLYVAGGLAIAGAAILILSDNDTNAEPCFPGNC